MSIEANKFLNIGFRSDTLSCRDKAIAYTFLSSFGLITVLSTIFIALININNHELLSASAGYLVILLISGSAFFIYSITAAVWYILKAVEDIVKK